MRKVLGGLAIALGVAVSVFGADVADLVKQLKDEDADARRAAAKALAEAGGDAKTAVPALVAALKDPDKFVRRFSAMALGEIGAEPKDALPGLKAALNDPKKEVQEAAAGAIGKMGPDGVGALSAAVKDTAREPSVRRKAIEVLGQMGSSAKPAIPVLIEALKRGMANNKKKGPPDPADMRIEAAEALGNIASSSDKEVVDALESMLDKKQRNRNLQKAAREALAKLKTNKT